MRERFSYILAHFFGKKIIHLYMDNSRLLKMKFTAKFMPYNILLCYNRKICTARSDDSNIATSTVSSYKKLDYNRPCVRAIYPCQMPKNCCVPKCTKKGYIEEGKRFLISSYRRKSICSTSGYVRFVETLGDISRSQKTLVFAQGIFKTQILKFH